MPKKFTWFSHAFHIVFTGLPALSSDRVTPSNNFSNSHLYTWVESDTVRVKCLAQEHDVKYLPELLPRLLDLARDQRSNSEATAPLTTGFMVVHYLQVDLKRKGHALSCMIGNWGTGA